MKSFTLLSLGPFITTSFASPTNYNFTNPYSPIPDYPFGNGWCLTDSQANFIVNDFATALENPNRQAANASLQTLIATNFTETSDSIDTLAGFPLGSSSFASKAQYIISVVNAPAIPSFQTLQIFHDCTNIAWRWTIASLGKNVGEVKGINVFHADPKTGQLEQNFLEFNSIEWGRDIGWTCTPPPGH